MERSIAEELDHILSDLDRIGTLVAKREKEVEKVHDIYLLQEGTDTYKLYIDTNVFYVDRYELARLAAELERFGIHPHSKKTPDTF